jgi:hypothetical protein
MMPLRHCSAAVPWRDLASGVPLSPTPDCSYCETDCQSAACAKAAGVYVFGGGIDEVVPPVLVSADGTFAAGGYSWAPPLNGGFTVLELPSRQEAIAWAARLAKACRCQQELRVFGFDPAS